MELPASTSFRSVSCVSLCPVSSRRVFVYRFVFHGVKLSRKLHCSNPKRSLRITVNPENNGEDKDNTAAGANFFEESGFVEVIAIGSRKDAVVDFCLDSPFQLSSSLLLRFWNIHTKESLNVQLQERSLGKDLNPRIVKALEFLQPCSKAIILVASAGYGLDHVNAIDILKTVRARNGFSVAIFLKPFSFEGQRRQDEVKFLIGKLQEHTNFCIDIDTDTLLKKDLVTLDEALKTANNAVLLAINAISVLISGRHKKLIGVLDNNVKELKVSDILKILENYKEAKIGFGAGNSIKSSILKALYDCPFIDAGLKDLNGIVLCIIASSGLMDDRDLQASLHTFRQTAKYAGKIIISTAHEPNIEPNVLVTTVLIIGHVEQQAPWNSSILSRLAQHFPFIYKLLRRNHQQSNGNEGDNALKDAFLSKVINSPDSGAMENRIAVEGIAEDVDNISEEFETVSSSDYDFIYDPRNYNSRSEESEVGLLEARAESSNIYDQIAEGTPFQREVLNSWNLGPGYQIAQEWAKERAAAMPVLDNLSIFCLPVGVRCPEESKNCLNMSYSAELADQKSDDDVKEQTLVNSSVSSWGALTDAGFVAVRDFYNSASTLLKGRNADVPKKQGILSVRAASMLEAEHDSPKKWSPIMEMQYRGGVYRGRCQGGLPEGKGRLILGDGSVYEGMWRYGKKSGPGAFYFTNGDVFQGSWRDDAMHGKGWFYFHTGDRWFANFWKGKANGESRFYSKSSDVIFGHFQDGWRHGKFLCIDVDGARCVEIWDEGILVSRKQLDSDTGGAG